MHVTSWMLRPRESPFAPLSEAQSRIMFDLQWFVRIFKNLNLRRFEFTVISEMRSSLGPGAVFFESRVLWAAESSSLFSLLEMSHFWNKSKDSFLDALSAVKTLRLFSKKKQGIIRVQRRSLRRILRSRLWSRKGHQEVVKEIRESIFSVAKEQEARETTVWGQRGRGAYRVTRNSDDIEEKKQGAPPEVRSDGLLYFRADKKYAKKKQIGWLDR